MSDTPTKTDISHVPYTERYKTDDNGYRWILLEEAKREIKERVERIKELESALRLIASLWDDSQNQAQQSGAMYDSRCLALHALETNTGD